MPEVVWCTVMLEALPCFFLLDLGKLRSPDKFVIHDTDNYISPHAKAICKERIEIYGFEQISIKLSCLFK